MQRSRFKLLSFIICFLLIVVLTLVVRPKKILAQDIAAVSVSYQAHVQSIGWQKWVEGGVEAGTNGKSLRVEALKIKLVNAPVNASIKYLVHVQSVGWQTPVKDGEVAGTENKSLRVEAIKISLENMPGYEVQYQVHVQNIGWQDWVSDGQEAGTHGKSLRVEAIRIRVVPKTIHISSVSLNKITDTLTVGKSDTLAAVLTPTNALNQAVTWSSSKPSVVAVDSLGKITAISKGTAVVTVTTKDLNMAASCVITVNDLVVHPLSVSLNKTTDNLLVGATDILTVAINPLNSTNKDVTWTSSDPSIVSVDNEGKITMISEGSATITVATVDGKMSATCIVTGSSIIVPTQVKLNKTSDTLMVGDVCNLTAAITPSNSINQEVKWSSSNASIASVDSIGKVTAVGAGTVAITVTTKAGNVVASCIVAVNNPTNNNKFTLTNYNISLNDFGNQELLDTPAAYINNKWCYAMIKNGEYGYCTDPINPNDTWVCSQVIYDNIKNQLLYNMNPLNSQNDPTKIYEFVTLSYTDCVTAAQLNTMFGQSGVLSGKGQVFIDAAKANNVNPIYLAGHAILETGHGTSLLANGGTRDLAGNYTYGIAVYDLFGIGAIDGDADGGGTRTAYSNGWTSVDLAIYGGAAWISKSYISKSQDTLYSMRWNPLNINHQYATDVNWAASQTSIIKGYFDLLPGCTLTFSIPVFK